MQHTEIINTLSALLPQIKQSNSASDVLLKYAKENNLAAAQLERMSQMFNIAKTLNYMDKSAGSRGASFHTIDTPSLVAEYVSYSPVKKATTPQIPDDWATWLDMSGMTLKAASAVDPDNIESWIDSPEIVKLASLPDFKQLVSDINTGGESNQEWEETFSTTESTTRHKLIDILQKEASTRIELENVDSVIELQKEDFRKVAEEILHKLQWSPEISFADMEEDALGHLGAEVTKTASVLENYFTQRNWGITRLPEDFKFTSKLVRDRHSVVPLFKQANEALDLLQAAVDYREYFIKGAASAGVEDEEDVDVDDGPTEPRDPDAPQRDKRNKKDEDKKKQTVFKLRDPYETKGKPEDKGKSKLDFIDAPVKAISGELSPSKLRNSMVSNIGQLGSSMNTRQKSIDTSVMDVRRLVTLQKLMLHDPIISEADPDTVLSLYNTLAAANTELAKDPNLLRFALREALQYEAVPLHTYKDLVEMQKNRAQGNTFMDELQNNLYRNSPLKIKE